jgi:hypothetical protein
VFENRVLRRTFEPSRDEVTGGWRNSIKRRSMICRRIKRRSMRCARQVEFMGAIRNTCKILERLKGRDHSEQLGVVRSIILKWISGK